MGRHRRQQRRGTATCLRLEPGIFSNERTTPGRRDALQTKCAVPARRRAALPAPCRQECIEGGRGCCAQVYRVRCPAAILRPHGGFLWKSTSVSGALVPAGRWRPAGARLLERTNGHANEQAGCRWPCGATMAWRSTRRFRRSRARFPRRRVGRGLFRDDKWVLTTPSIVSSSAKLSTLQRTRRRG